MHQQTASVPLPGARQRSGGKAKKGVKQQKKSVSQASRAVVLGGGKGGRFLSPDYCGAQCAAWFQASVPGFNESIMPRITHQNRFSQISNTGRYNIQIRFYSSVLNKKSKKQSFHTIYYNTFQKVKIKR